MNTNDEEFDYEEDFTFKDSERATSRELDLLNLNGRSVLTVPVSDGITSCPDRGDRVLRIINLEHLNGEERRLAEKLVRKYADRFSLDGEEIPVTNIVMHRTYHRQHTR
ncbi:hypothetical protein QAD02_007424 [Eretmocerus hayati]|uniref:Uncharacterized protein n=1 Tax=Eretmocerus hayati TaxID=131215 RepID=A0ACC2N3L5_9HYME|nr:hypothetical protein QAD02_007424 [Eretmocerus hayati]